MSPFTELSLTGRVATPAYPDWDQTRQAWNLAADPHPAAVAYVEGADDIAAVIRYAAAHELKVIGQTTGHGAAPVGPVEDTIVIKTERMRKIEIDREAKTARIERQAAIRESLPSLANRRPEAYRWPDLSGVGS